MNDSTFPRDYKPAKDGDVEGKFVELRRATVADFKTGKPVEKALVELELDDGELLTVWMDGVIKSKFAEELRARIEQRGATTFEPGERIAIHYKGMRVSRTGTKYHDFDPDFEFGVPKRSAADVLLDSSKSDESEEPNGDDPESDEPEEDDSIPF